MISVIRKKAKRILIPYVCFFLLSCLYYVGCSPDTLLSLPAVFFFLHGQTLWNAPLWFLPTMFLDSVAFALAIKVDHKHPNRAVIALTTLCFLITVLLYTHHLAIDFLGIDKAIHMLGYMGVGFLTRGIVDRVVNTQHHPSVKTVSLLSLLIFIGFCLVAGILNDNNNISIMKCDYNNILTYIPLAIIGSLSFLFLFVALPANKTVETIAKDTVFIMSVHYFLLVGFRHIVVWTMCTCLLAAFLSVLILTVFCVVFRNICRRLQSPELIKLAECFGLLAIK